MKHEHISTRLDHRAPGPWTAEEIESARQAASCPECHSAWAAAQAARTLLETRAAASVAPPPDFAAALMRALEVPALPLVFRLWRANSRLIYATAACLALLTALALREELTLRSREYSEAAIEAASMAVAHDIAMGGNDEDAVSN